MSFTDTVLCCRTDSGVLSSFYSYFTLAESSPQPRAPSADEQRATNKAHQVIEECHVEQIVQDSKFLRQDSLQELIKVRSDISCALFSNSTVVNLA